MESIIAQNAFALHVSKLLEQVHEGIAALCRDTLNRLRVEREHFIVSRWVGQRGRQLLVANWAEQDKARLLIQFENRIDEFVVARRELFESSFAVERIGHAVAEHDYSGPHLLDLLNELLDPFGGPFRPIETRARLSLRRVRAPAEITERDVSVRKPQRHH